MTIPIPEKTIVFVHIPKTAGTTLYHLLERQYPPGQFYIMADVLRDLPNFQTMPSEHKAHIRMLAGHFSFGIHQYLPHPAAYFTIVRQPINLTISYFYYMRTEVSHPNFHLAKSMSLTQFLDSRIDENMSNVQTRMLAGITNDGSYYECTPADLETAKENLRHSFTVVGLTERFDETLLLLKKAFGWQNLTYARMNVTRKKPHQSDLSPDMLQAIAQANLFDQALYQFATTLFNDQIAQQGPDFARQVADFQQRNRWHYLFRYSVWQARRQRWLLQKNGALWLHDFYVRGRNRLLQKDRSNEGE